MEQALKKIQNSAKQGDYDAQYSVGVCYEEGIGVEADINSAYDWYSRAAAQGHSGAKKAMKRLKQKRWIWISTGTMD